MINTQEHRSKEFELVIQVRDNNGLPSGKTKSIQTNDAADLEGFLNKNIGRKKRRSNDTKKKSKE